MFLNQVHNIIGKDICNGFKLPGEGSDAHYILPISGGADSSCTAIVMLSLFPNVDWKLVFTDTGDESEALYKRLDELEKQFGRKIIRLTNNGETLYSLIDKYNGFLPGTRSRWCTRALKIEPLDLWLSENFDTSKDEVYTFVGIRYDEDRFGMVSEDDNVNTVFPLTKLKVTKEMVFSLLESTVGIPGDYKDRTRSGCDSCFYQANHELLRLFVTNPKKFELAKSKETFSESDSERFKKLESDFNKTFASAYSSLNPAIANYPVPPSIDVRSLDMMGAFELPKPVFKSQSDTPSLLSSKIPHVEEEYTSLFVAVAFLADKAMPLFGKESGTGVYDQRLISFSKSFTGLKRSMAFYWRHRLNTARVWNETEQSLMTNLKIGIYRLEVPARLVDLDKTGAGSYSWKSDITYLQLEHHFKLAHTILTKAGYEQYMNELRKQEPTDWRVEEYKATRRKHKMLSSTQGFVTWMGLCNLTQGKTRADDLIHLEQANQQGSLFGQPEDPQKQRKRKVDQEDNSLQCVICSL